MTQTKLADTDKPRRPAGLVQWAGVAATAVLALMAVLAYVWPTEPPSPTAGGNSQPAGGGGAPTGAAVPLSGSTAVAPAPSGDSPSAGLASAGPSSGSRQPGVLAVGETFLDTLTPVAGQPRVQPLPAELAGQPGYERPVVIACPSNEAADQLSEVTYQTTQRFSRLTATLRPFRDPADGVRADLFVFEDDADSRPGADFTQVRVTMGDSSELSAPIAQAYYLRLRVVCERTGGLMILADARLTAR